MFPSKRAWSAIFLLLAALFLAAAGCQRQTRAAPPRLTPPTATPFPLRPHEITPDPSPTALFRAGRVFGKYNQSLTLYVGDTFVLDTLHDAASPVTYDDSVLRLISDPGANFTEPKTFQAVKPGKTEIRATVAAPCPNAPAGCQPPEDKILVVVSVTEPGP